MRPIRLSRRPGQERKDRLSLGCQWFASNFTINPDGTDLFQVTNLPPASNNFAWFYDYSPDGKQFVLGHDMTGTLELYVINADGTDLHQITHDAGGVPHWSPDGSRIVYATIGDFDLNVIVTIRADGTEKRVISSPVWDSIQAEYTPDGRHIIFSTTTGGFVSALWIMDTEGKHQGWYRTRPLRLAHVISPRTESRSSSTIIRTRPSHTKASSKPTLMAVEQSGSRQGRI
jgi:Tol biopolymer transport system component